MTEHPTLAAALIETARAAFNPYADRGAPLATRLRNRYVEIPSGCWIWLSTINRSGYGLMNLRPRARIAHRVMYEELVGPVPEGLVLDHLCRTKSCVNPDHLEPVTQAENVRRHNEQAGVKQYAKRCPNGHDQAEHGVQTAQGYRRCRICTAETNRRRYLRKKGRLSA